MLRLCWGELRLRGERRLSSRSSGLWFAWSLRPQAMNSSPQTFQIRSSVPQPWDNQKTETRPWSRSFEKHQITRPSPMPRQVDKKSTVDIAKPRVVLGRGQKAYSWLQLFNFMRLQLGLIANRFLMTRDSLVVKKAMCRVPHIPAALKLLQLH